MATFNTPFVWALAVFLAFQFAILVFVVLPNIGVLKSAIGVPQKLAAVSGNSWAAFRLRLVGLKTIVTAVFGSLMIALPDILQGVHGIDFSGTALAQYSSIIGLVCITGMAIFHSIGIKHAGLAAPASPEE